MKKKSKKKKIIITVSVIIAIFLIAYIYLFLGSKQKGNKEIIKGEDGTNALIIYFTRSGNIKAKAASDVDAASSASMKSNDGATKFAAEKLQEVTGADMYEIKTERRYRPSYFGTAATAFIEEGLNLRPDIAAYPDLSQYDIIYVGYPIWWFNAPMAIGTFLEHYDLTGKTIVPFCTAQDNDIDVSMKYIRKVSKNAVVTEGYRFMGTTSKEDIMRWLDGIGMDIETSDKDGNIDEASTIDTDENAAEDIVENTKESDTKNVDAQTTALPTDITVGSVMMRGFINDNTLHSEQYGDIHYSSYIPDSYDGSEKYALFITMPGWEGLYFQGVGANMAEDFGTEAPKYNDKMIVLSTQLDDWGETSANMVIALTEYFLEHYNIDSEKVYLEGLSGGGETGSIVICKRPELYTAYLMTSSQWDGNLEILAESRTPVYMAIGEKDSYYGSDSLKKAYQTLYSLYEKQDLSDDQIDEILVLDVKQQKYFSDRGFTDQHAGGFTFAHDETIMGWLFGEH